MATISVSLPSDGETIDAADYNTPINTIVTAINGNLDNANISTSAAIAGSKLADGAITNAKLSTATGELGGAWASYTPTFTNLSGGTLNYGKYMQIGKTVFFKVKYTMSGTNISGLVKVTAPVSIAQPSPSATSDTFSVVVEYVDFGGNAYPGIAAVDSSSAFSLYCVDASGSFASYAGINASKPLTWGNNDYFIVSGHYEAA